MLGELSMPVVSVGSATVRLLRCTHPREGGFTARLWPARALGTGMDASTATAVGRYSVTQIRRAFGVADNGSARRARAEFLPGVAQGADEVDGKQRSGKRIYGSQPWCTTLGVFDFKAAFAFTESASDSLFLRLALSGKARKVLVAVASFRVGLDGATTSLGRLARVGQEELV